MDRSRGKIRRVDLQVDGNKNILERRGGSD